MGKVKLIQRDVILDRKEKKSFVRASQYFELVMRGNNVVVYDFDEPRLPDGTPICLEVTLDLLREKINDIRFPFGHGYIVTGMISGIHPSAYLT